MMNAPAAADGFSVASSRRHPSKHASVDSAVVNYNGVDLKGYSTDLHSITTMSSSMAVGLQRGGGHGENYFDLTMDDDDSPDAVHKGTVTDDDRNYSGAVATSTSYRRTNKPRHRQLVFGPTATTTTVIDLVGCSSEDDEDVQQNTKNNTRSLFQERNIPQLIHPLMRRKRTRSPALKNEKYGGTTTTTIIPRATLLPTSHVNLSPRSMVDGTKITFGLLGLVDILKDSNTLTCEGNITSSMTKLLAPAYPPSSTPASCSSSASTMVSSTSSSLTTLAPIPFNHQPLHYLQNDNWSCGYRNLQMLLSGMMPTLHHVFPNGVPCVHEIQGTMEQLWKHGFDVRNAEHHGHALVGKRTWIGTVEVWSYLSYKCIDSIIVQFIKTPRNRALLGNFVWAYFTKFGRYDNDDGVGGMSMSIFPTCAEYAENLISEITKPNFTSQWGDGLRQMGQSIIGSLPPLYLQWKGHSITIVGIRKEMRTTATSNDDGQQHPSPSFTLIIFCPQKNVSDIKSTLMREFESKINDMSSLGGGGKTNNNNINNNCWPVLELPANKLLQKDCQILLSTARVIDEKESNRRKFCSINLGFLNAVSNDYT